MNPPGTLRAPAEAGPQTARGAGRLRRLARSERLTGVLLSAPAMMYFAGFWLVPFGLAIYYSFTHYDLFTAPKWAGGANYAHLFSGDPEFRHVLAITGLFVIVTVIPTLILALALAVPASRGGRVHGVYRALLMIPAIMPLVASAVVWIVIYSPNGLANSLLGFLGVSPVAWLTGISPAYWGMVLLTIWKSLGIFFLIILAGLQGIPPTLYQAAALDGAGPVRVFFRITLPAIRRTMAFTAVIGVVGAAQSFAPAYILTGGGPANATELLPLYMYKTAFNFSDMGLAAAISVVLTVVLFVIAIVQFQVIQGRVARG